MDRKADPQTQLLVDEAILDYFMYTASKAMLKSPKDTVAAEGHAHLPLQMVGCKDRNRGLNVRPSS